MDTDNPFEKVLGRLREKGWIQQSYGKREGPNCMRGAASHTIRDVRVLYSYALPIIQAEYPGRVPVGNESIVQFNDHPETTFEDVERVLEKAAVKWEEERVLRDEN